MRQEAKSQRKHCQAAKGPGEDAEPNDGVRGRPNNWRKQMHMWLINVSHVATSWLGNMTETGET